MKKITRSIVAAFHCVFHFLKRLIFSTEQKVFVDESYKALLPLISSLNSYLQTFLGVLASSLMALDSAFIVVILSEGKIKSVTYFSFGLSIFIASIFLYIFSFYIVLKLRLSLLNSAKLKNIKFEHESYAIESGISQYITYIIVASCAFFLSFLCLLPCLIK